MYSDGSGNLPKWAQIATKFAVGLVIITGLTILAVATAGTGVAAITAGAAIGASVGGAAGMISGITVDESDIGYDWNKASTGFMLGTITGAISGAVGGGLSKSIETGSYISRSILALVDGTLSVGSYYAQAAIDGELHKTSGVGALISFGTGLFDLCNPLDSFMDYLWSPIIGAEIGWTYDVLYGLFEQKKLKHIY